MSCSSAQLSDLLSVIQGVHKEEYTTPVQNTVLCKIINGVILVCYQKLSLPTFPPNMWLIIAAKLDNYNDIHL